MKLKKLEGKTWADVVSFMETNRHALAVERTNPEFVSAKTAQTHGSEAGAAAVTAFLFLNRFGAPRTAWRAVCIYEQVSPKHDLIGELKDSLSWVGAQSLAATIPFPVKDLPTDPDKQAGLANVMMMVAACEMSKGTTTQVIATQAISKFLQTGLSRAKARL